MNLKKLKIQYYEVILTMLTLLLNGVGTCVCMLFY